MKIGLMRLACITLTFLSSFAGAAEPPPLVDGDCSEYPALPSKRLQLDAGIELYLYQDEHYVWMCYTYPAGSLGMLDMTLKTSALASPLNLHASAQLGEWPADRDDLAPQSPESDRWWNISGWTANTIWFNGMEVRNGKPAPHLRNAQARELQLSKRRFGRGEWHFAMTIHQVKNQDGTMRQVRFPASGNFSLTVY